jgi:hypothetical protein
LKPANVKITSDGAVKVLDKLPVHLPPTDPERFLYRSLYICVNFFNTLLPNAGPADHSRLSRSTVLPSHLRREQLVCTSPN